MKRARQADIYIGAVILTGSVILGLGVQQWHTTDWTRYLFYCVITLLASGMKVTLPAVTGAMSMNFLFVLIGIADLSLGETLIMGCLGMLLQCVFHTKKRPQPVQVLFSVASMACSIAAAYEVYHAPFLRLQSFEAPLLLLLAAMAFFLTNTASIAVVIALTEDKSIRAVWRESYLWTFPNYLVGAAVAWMLSAASRLFGWQTSLLLLPILYVIYRSHHLYVKRLEDERARAQEQRIHAEEMAALHHRTIEALALAIEAKDQTTHDHLARVEVYAIEVGRELGLSGPELEALRAAAMLHDIGKLAVPEYIISKPGKLTPDEFEKMKVHPVVGAEILESVRFPYPVAPIVRSHHEKWDGSGYPDGLSGDQIPAGARILSAVDCLDALASDRQYRRALPLDEAIKVVQGEGGKAFDPKVVSILARRYVELERMATSAGRPDNMKLSTGIKIERGAAPAAGFESASSVSELMSFQHSIADADRLERNLADLTQRLERCEDRRAIFALLRAELAQLIPYDAIALYRRAGDILAPELLEGEDRHQFASIEVPFGKGLSGWVAENAKSILNGNPSVEPGFLYGSSEPGALGSALAAPLETPAGVVGVLSLYRRDRDAFSSDDLGRLISFGSRLARVLNRGAQLVEARR